jgi:hypothetical protein
VFGLLSLHLHLYVLTTQQGVKTAQQDERHLKTT